ncbi:MAG: hypothetical protein CL537_05625 [Alcanivoracaceae bacterium]|jgi:hypothetical protein|uniref:Uncharacterized protein n=1 Tax=Alcanivorax profundi TaxID=2338368 RepID=A0A418XTI2_9GAMM|nr:MULTISPECIES: hypothetical protein [Alcanivorax]MAX54977.1 hypothetical protein [Alcanivoracaceae bacterium]MCG8438084.1 hypothetical protein [Pseudomonadales bacterium]MED5433204.1 hypothetical protein [Pseudomonadota bacterium]ERP86898.1 hypothetical protein Q670_04750 [Alcanivorax sp. P2S70]MEE2869303.1 hypothetical protein [Pseudomonadota bacterium]
MAFDPRDPYDAAALYDMWLNCSRCPTSFDYEPGGDIDLDYYHRIGQQARVENWAVLPARSQGDELMFNVLCPVCADRLGVSGCDGRMELAAPVIDQICRAMRLAS